MKQRLLVAAVGVPLLIVGSRAPAAYRNGNPDGGHRGLQPRGSCCIRRAGSLKLLYVPTILCAALVVLAIVFGTAVTATADLRVSM